MAAADTDPDRSSRTGQLTADAIVEAATALVRTRGVEGLRMRSVAAELGVTPMALYYHVPSKDELLGLVARSVLDAAAPLEPGPGGWEEALREHLMSTWRVLRDYPGLAGHMINLPTMGTTPEKYRAGVRFFEDAGFAPEVATLAWSFAFTYVHGRLSVDARFDRDAAHVGGIDRLPASAHVAFGVDGVILALAAMLADPVRAASYTSAP